MFDLKRNMLLDNMDPFHRAYYDAETFHGPSLYFHLKSLKSARDHDFERFSECTYAMLTAWGMHRMGMGGSKMRYFDEFKCSLAGIWDEVLALQTKTPCELEDQDWEALKKVFCGIRVMASATSLIGNSKVMAHAIPSLVPPVDREYTLKLLYGRGEIQNGLEGEWTRLKEILSEFFYPLLGSETFSLKATGWKNQVDVFPWDTSDLKILDNLIIGSRYATVS
jgi:hypothetical protein